VPWLAKLRLQVFALLLALVVGVVGVVGVFSVPVIPAVGVALFAAVAAVNSMTAKLSTTVCAGCGEDISAGPAGTYGITCAHCGTINQPYRADASKNDDDDAESVNEDGTPRRRA